MTALFHVVDEATVILRNKKGVYRQAKVYSRGDRLYAGYGPGFVRLLTHGTSHPDISWEDLSAHPNIISRRNGGPSFKEETVRARAA